MQNASSKDAAGQTIALNASGGGRCRLFDDHDGLGLSLQRNDVAHHGNISSLLDKLAKPKKLFNNLIFDFDPKIKPTEYLAPNCNFKQRRFLHFLVIVNL